jgi:hypothetical protein
VTLWSIEPETIAWNCCEAAAANTNVTGETEIDTTGGGDGRGRGLRVMVAAADLLESALLRAVTTKVIELLVAGATYKPEAEMVPTKAPPPSTPLTSHATLLSVTPLTVA